MSRIKRGTLRAVSNFVGLYDQDEDGRVAETVHFLVEWPRKVQMATRIVLHDANDDSVYRKISSVCYEGWRRPPRRMRWKVGGYPYHRFIAPRL